LTLSNINLIFVFFIIIYIIFYCFTTLGNYCFNKDLIEGKSGENVVINHIIRLLDYKAKLIKINNNNKFDFIIEHESGLSRSYEVKTDTYISESKDSGNMFVEFECRNKPSGISTSLADWFVYYIPYLSEIYYIKTDDLKELISNNNFKVTNNSGDLNSNTKGYLINRYNYRFYFKIYQLV